MDYYCQTDKFPKAVEIFNKLKISDTQPDSFSYSILIKGLKKVEGESQVQ
jgi:pentatricopeptide repeat protein